MRIFTRSQKKSKRSSPTNLLCFRKKSLTRTAYGVMAGTGLTQRRSDTDIGKELMQRFLGKRVLVTGSGRGIGAAIARRFALEGASVHLTARGKDELNKTREDLRTLTSEVQATVLDLTEPDAAPKLAAEVAQAWGGLDILVTNAGSAPQGGFLELSDDDWPAGFGLKLFANLRVIKQTWPLLKASRNLLK